MPFDENDQTDLNTLKTEVETDPRGVGFDPLGGTQAILDLLNIVANNPSADTVNIPFDEFPAIDVIDEIDEGEYNALTGFDKSRVDAIMNAAIESAISTSEFSQPAVLGPVKALFRKSFGANSITWQAVQADRARDASIAENLFGRDTFITDEDWFAARDNGVVV